MTIKDIFEIKTKEDFEDITLEVFKFQFEKSPVYRTFCNYLKMSPKNVRSIKQIPYLPIEFFKRNKVLIEDEKAQIIFESSGTTGVKTSKHYISDVSIYQESFSKGFELS